MRFLIQRVLKADVTVDERVVGSIGKGFLVLIGVTDTDDEKTADLYVRKMLGLRIFEDENGKTNLSLKDVDGQLLLVSQFTLYANCKRETGRASQMPASRSMRKSCMNTLSARAGSRFLWSGPVNSGLI